MKIISRLTIATIILNLFIVIPYGGFLIVVEYGGLSLLGGFESNIIGIVSFVTQIILLISLSVKTKKTRIILIIPSLLVMWTTLYYMIVNGFNNIFSNSVSIDTTISLSSIPFIILSIILIYQLLKINHMKASKKE